MTDDRPADLSTDGMRVLLVAPTTRDAAAIHAVLRAAKINCTVCADIDKLCQELTRGAGLVMVSEESVIKRPHGLSWCVREQPVWSDLPVIVLSRSGAESPELGNVLSSLGNVSVLERPVRTTTLIIMIRSAMRARERQYQVRDHLIEREKKERALELSEGRFRQLADAMPQMVWVTLPDGRHEYYNRRWYEFTGVPVGSTDGDGWNGVFHPNDQENAWNRWRHSLSTGEPYEIEYRLRHRSGEYRWTLGRALPIRDEVGRIVRWFGTCTDIDAMKRLTGEREHLLDSERNARAEAERASQMKDDFLATLSHELRTPLNAILGWVQIIKTNPNDEGDVKEGIEVIERNARSQTQIIEDLLDMSRIINGKIRLDIQPVDLASVVSNAEQSVRPAADARGVRIFSVLDRQNHSIAADPGRLQQILWNLLTNAVKFTPKSGQVQLRLERTDSSLEVTVADTGEGIDAAFLPHVFDRFRQADASTTRRHGGLGLGLAIVKQLVELHGGSIRASSPGPGRGSVFTVTLPVSVALPAPVVHEEHRHPVGKVSVPTNTCSDIAGIKVLVVDDEPDARSMMQRVLEDCGAVVSSAANVSQAVERMRAEIPDVIISDIGMPTEDGYALMRRVRALPPADGGLVPAVAVTAYARSEDRQKAIAAGFQHHIAKPIEPAELIRLVASLAGIEIASH